MRTRGLRLIVVGCLIAVAQTALAQPTSVEEKKREARALYEAGSVKYDLGRYQEAIDLFTKSYETFPASALLFNLAQSHRQLGNCSDAIFFYTRFLEKKPDAPNRAEVDGLIQNLKTDCKDKPASAPPPEKPTAVTPTRARTPAAPTATPKAPTAPAPTAAAPPPAASTPTAEYASGPTGGEVAATHATDGASTLLALRFAAGPSFPSFGDLSSAAGLGFALGAAYPLLRGDLAVDAGGLLTFAPVRWGEVEPGSRTGTAGLTGLLANAGADLALMTGLRGRAELGFGLLVMSGVDQPGNPFIDDESMATGPLSFFLTRFALGAEYALSDKLVLSAQPIVLSWSPAKKLRDEVGSITRFEMLVGVCYRL